MDPWEHDVVSFNQQLLQATVSVTVRPGEQVVEAPRFPSQRVSRAEPQAPRLLTALLAVPCPDNLRMTPGPHLLKTLLKELQIPP